MKNIYNLVAILCVFMITSCGSDDNDNAQADHLVGKWTLSQSIFNGEQEPLTECDKKETFDFSNDNRLIITTYSGANCSTPDATILDYTYENNIVTYTNPTGGYDGGEFTRKYKVNRLTGSNLELELFYEIDGFGEEGELSDKWVTVWIK